MTDKPPLAARNFPTAEEEARVVEPPVGRYAGPESAYRLAFTDTDFLLRDELRPVRVQLELLKPEIVQAEHGIESTIVIFGSARILSPELAATTTRRGASPPSSRRGRARWKRRSMSSPAAARSTSGIGSTTA